MNEKKLGIHIALFGALIGSIASFVGIIVDKHDGGKNTFNSLLLGILGIGVAAIIGAIYHLYLRKKYPKTVKGMAAGEKDERGQLIRGKTSTYTLIFISFLAAGLFIYSFLKEYKIISSIISTCFVITVFFNITVNSYLDKNS